MIRDDGHGCENYLECWQILKSAVDVSQELQVVGVHVHRLGPLAGLVDLGRQQVEDEGQGSGGVRLQTKHVRATTKKNPGFLVFFTRNMEIKKRRGLGCRLFSYFFLDFE